MIKINNTSLNGLKLAAFYLLIEQNGVYLNREDFNYENYAVNNTAYNYITAGAMGAPDTYNYRFIYNIADGSNYSKLFVFNADDLTNTFKTLALNTDYTALYGYNESIDGDGTIIKLGTFTKIN